MITLQDIDVVATPIKNGFVVKGRTFEEDDFEVQVPTENHVLTLKETNTEFTQSSRPWVSNALLRVEMSGQQGKRCAIELPYPDLQRGKNLVVSSDYVKKPRFTKTEAPTIKTLKTGRKKN